MNIPGAEELLVDDEARYTRRWRRLHERRLPPGLREDISRLRRDDLACGVLDSVFAEVRKIAALEGVVRSEPALVGHREYVPAVHERRVLRQLDQNDAFRRSIRRKVRDLVRTAHVIRTAPPIFVPAHLGRITDTTAAGPLLLRSSIGLGTASFLDAEPEELNVLVHDGIVEDWKRREATSDIGLDEGVVNVAVLGSGAGGFARIVESRAERCPRILVHEWDPLVDTRTALPCVRPFRPSAGTSLDYGLVVLRAPATGGAANHGCIYSEAGDLSKLGVARWTKRTAELLRSLGGILTEGALVFVVTPASVRTDRGYRRAPALLDGVLEGLRLGHLAPEKQRRIVEVEPVRRPFVGANAPERWIVIARKAAEAS